MIDESYAHWAAKKRTAEEDRAIKVVADVLIRMNGAMSIESARWVAANILDEQMRAAEAAKPTDQVEVSDALYRLTDQTLAFAGRVIVDVGPSEQFEEGRRLALADIETIAKALGLKAVYGD